VQPDGGGAIRGPSRGGAREIAAERPESVLRKQDASYFWCDMKIFLEQNIEPHGDSRPCQALDVPKKLNVPRSIEEKLQIYQ